MNFLSQTGFFTINLSSKRFQGAEYFLLQFVLKSFKKAELEMIERLEKMLRAICGGKVMEED